MMRICVCVSLCLLKIQVIKDQMGLCDFVISNFELLLILIYDVLIMNN